MGMSDASGFTKEQVAALVSALGKLDLQGRAADPSANAEAVHGTPLEDLCKEEVAKYQLHPLDLWVRLEQWTARNEIAVGLDQFLLRHLGFFNVEPTSPGYMVRLRLPGCQLRGDQLQRLAQIADDYAGGYCHVTTRGNLQIREIEPKNVLAVLDALNQAGLSCAGSGADSARNLTTSPTAGFDAVELVDLSPYTRRLSNAILNTRELRALPRKFNISFDNGGRVSAVSDSNDICFQALAVSDDAPIDAGVYCRISLGGISGHEDLARETGMICTPEQSVLAGIAMLNVFVAHADRTNRKRARLKYLLDERGVAWFVEETQAQLTAMEAGFQLLALEPQFDLPRPDVDRRGHIGVHAQRQSGKNYLGVALEMGRMSATQMRTVGSLALEHGNNDIRLTVWQNLLIPFLTKEKATVVAEEIRRAGMKTEATAFAAGAVACTGKAGCKLAHAYTKEDGLALVRHLEERFTLDKPINIHLTGCPNSCAQHYIGDIGLVGVTLPDGGEGYHLVMGGGSDIDKGIGRSVAGPIPVNEVNATIEAAMSVYLANRAANETFLQFVRNMPDEALPTLIDIKTLAV